MFFWKRRESSGKERGRVKEVRKSSNHGRIAWRISAAVLYVLVAPASGAVDDGVIV